MLLSNCVVCGSKILRLMKHQETMRILSSLETRKSLSQILLVGPVLF